LARNPDRSWWHCHTNLKLFAAAHVSKDRRERKDNPASLAEISQHVEYPSHFLT
jgi:hypothetical protein